MLCHVCKVFFQCISTFAPLEYHTLFAGIYDDARAAVDYICRRTDINQQKVMLFGRSLGGAIALNIASDPSFMDRIAAVIVENTFTSIPEMARSLFNFSVLHYLPEWCYKNKVFLIKCYIYNVIFI